ncbi:MAG: c-type cytochrome, partial [Bacteroidota bacterium]|nr:c-type cytochrome [Bacteroidota bacterium]
ENVGAVVDYVRKVLIPDLAKLDAEPASGAQAGNAGSQAASSMKADMGAPMPKGLVGNTQLGEQFYLANCATCHGKNGEGGVGPNLTDAYWLHGGSINDVFKTIKYGWPEKGMKSWKDDFSPSQIAQIASYVKSLTGSNPPNPKPPQGILAK